MGDLITWHRIRFKIHIFMLIIFSCLIYQLYLVTGDNQLLLDWKSYIAYVKAASSAGLRMKTSLTSFCTTSQTPSLARTSTSVFSSISWS
ncbi:putative protein phosphatase 2C [Trifolium repens]|nr:putative protein phosphatase 2C [Trifolium repens]